MRTPAARPRSPAQADDIDLHVLLSTVLERGASDLHLTTGSRPQLRLNGHLSPLEDFPVLTPPVIQRVMYAAITQRQREKFEEILELDFAYSVPGKARFRVNIYRQRDSLGAAFRLIPFEIKKLEDLGIPPSASRTSRCCRVASSWSPGRPARASRRRWPRSSTWPTASAATTS